jgi:hypothetical protein
VRRCRPTTIVLSWLRTSPPVCRKRPCGHQLSTADTNEHPADLLRERRTVNPPTAHYNLLYCSKAGLRAASGRPPARRRHDGHRGTDFTLPDWGRSATPSYSPDCVMRRRVAQTTSLPSCIGEGYLTISS